MESVIQESSPELRTPLPGNGTADLRRYGSVRGDGLQNPVTGEGVAPVAHERRGKRGLPEAPSLELQKMNDQMHNLPAERQPQHSPQRRVRATAENTGASECFGCRFRCREDAVRERYGTAQIV